MLKEPKFNTKIIQELNRAEVPIKDALCYLTSIYLDIQPSFIPNELSSKVLSLNFISYDYENRTYVWKESLFEESEKGFEWVSEWMDLFGKINRERRGVKKYVISRMKRFFAENPSVRKEDVFKATERYLRSVSSPQYLKSSHKFIYDGAGVSKTSMLEEYIEITREEDSAPSTMI